MKYTLYEYMYGWMHWVSLTETLKLKKRTKQPNFHLDDEVERDSMTTYA